MHHVLQRESCSNCRARVNAPDAVAGRPPAVCAAKDTSNAENASASDLNFLPAQAQMTGRRPRT